MIAELDSILDRDEYIAAQIALHEYVADQGWIFATKKPTTPVVYRADLAGVRQYRLPTIHVYLANCTGRAETAPHPQGSNLTLNRGGVRPTRRPHDLPRTPTEVRCAQGGKREM
jgi:hypothetical protein